MAKEPRGVHLFQATLGSGIRQNSCSWFKGILGEIYYAPPESQHRKQSNHPQNTSISTHSPYVSLPGFVTHATKASEHCWTTTAQLTKPSFSRSALKRFLNCLRSYASNTRSCLNCYRPTIESIRASGLAQGHAIPNRTRLPFIEL